MRKMLINATQPEETRIAITENDKLFDLDIEHVDHEQKKSNIYKAKISRIEPSLNAVFVNYGEEKNGFLPAKEISPEYFTKKVNPDDNLPPLNEILNEGQEIIIQINKEERGTKGAALTTFLTLAGCYVVLMPNNPSAGGISRRIEGQERQALKDLIDSMNVPDEMGIIVRTAGADRSPEEIQWDLNILLNLWETIKNVSKTAPAPFLIHRESDITMRAIRDYLRDDIDEIIVDTDEGFQDLSRQISMLRPDFLDRLTKSESEQPLFSKFHIESQIENAYQREVRLPSGGSIVIDTTEALTAIDVNSAKSTKRGSIEETALHTNLEAAEEAARQIRLRDIGGLIIIDFIDMEYTNNQKEVENFLADTLQKDRAKIHLTRISKFGLVEVSRQRLSSSLDETSTISCPRCEGQGIIRSVQSLGLSILRLIEEEALKEKTNEVRVQLPVAVSTFLLNEKRHAITELEQRLNIKIVLIPNSNLDTPHYRIQRIWGDVYSANRPSHELIEANKKDHEAYDPSASTKIRQQPAIRALKMNAAPQNQNDGFFSKLIKSIFGGTSENTDIKKAKTTQQNKQDKTKNQQNKSKQNSQKQNTVRNNDLGNQKRKNAQRSNNRSKYSNSNRTNIHKSEELIDLSNNRKQQSTTKPVSQAPKPKKPAGLKVTPLVYNPQTSKKPKAEEHISKMVQDILENSSSLSVDNAAQVETSAETNKTNKYLKFDVIDLKSLVEKTDQKEEQTSKSQTKDNKNTAKETAKKEKMPIKQQESYDPAIDPTSQGYLIENVKNNGVKTSNKNLSAPEKSTQKAKQEAIPKTESEKDEIEKPTTVLEEQKKSDQAKIASEQKNDSTNTNTEESIEIIITPEENIPQEKSTNSSEKDTPKQTTQESNQQPKIANENIIKDIDHSETLPSDISEESTEEKPKRKYTPIHSDEIND